MGKTLLMYATIHHQPEVVALLLQSGANTETRCLVSELITLHCSGIDIFFEGQPNKFNGCSHCCNFLLSDLQNSTMQYLRKHAFKAVTPMKGGKGLSQCQEFERNTLHVFM